MRRRPTPAGTLVLLLTLLLGSCGQRSDAPRAIGNPEAGEALLAAHGCGSCHSIPGVTGADGTIGPPLDGFGNRTFIAGKLPNRLPHLIRWIRTPQAVEPGTAMPNLPVNEAEAWAMAAYLYSLQ